MKPAVWCAVDGCPRVATKAGLCSDHYWQRRRFPDGICQRCGQQHERCNGHNKAGEPCGRPPAPFSSVCRFHGARLKGIKAAAQRRQREAEAVTELLHLGYRLETTPPDALLNGLAEAEWNVAVLRGLVQQLQLGEGGIYANTFHVSGRPTGEAKPHVLVQMYDRERDRRDRLAEACAKLNLDTRRVAIAEAEGRMLQASLLATLAEVVPAELHARFSEVLANDLRQRIALPGGLARPPDEEPAVD